MSGLLAAKTVAKISLYGGDYKAEIAKEIPPEHLPALVGGPYTGFQQYTPFPFDTSYFCGSSDGTDSHGKGEDEDVTDKEREEKLETVFEAVSLDNDTHIHSSSSAIPTFLSPSTTADNTPSANHTSSSDTGSQLQPQGTAASGTAVPVQDISLISLTTVGH